jgi:hypothetical protein
MTDFEIPPPPNFVQIVRETAQWCALRADPADPEHSLRSPELVMTTPMGYWMQSIDASSLRSAITFRRFVTQLDTLVGRRHELIAQIIHPLRVSGRLLAYFPNDTDAGGWGAGCSKNFLDQEDCPPCDTWICAIQIETEFSSPFPILICWIPEVFYAVMESGMDCQMMRSADWIEEGTGHIPILGELHRWWLEASRQESSGK